MRALTDDDRVWLAAHAGDDPKKLMLKYHGDPQLTWLAMQLECRRKARGKIAPELIDRLVYPNTLAVEQCTSTEIAEAHARLLECNAPVLDMTCGLGMDSFSLARKGAMVTACDLKADNAETARLNASELGLSTVRVLNENSLKVLAEAEDGAFQTIIVDPARRGSGGKRLYSLDDCEPRVADILPLAAVKASRLFVKASPMLDIHDTLQRVAPYHADVHIFGTRTECKELCLDFIFEGANQSEPSVTCHTVGADSFRYRLADEQDTPCAYSLPAVGSVIYEPFPSVVKGGGFRSLAQASGLAMLSPQSHLYVAENEEQSFPGTPWKVEATMSWGKDAIKRVREQWSHISVATRGFILDAESLRKRLKVSEGPGEMKLWGVTAADGTPMLLVGRRL
ncbi:MAG: methyltransferase domain-containing protein [Candidatus Amulumruptor caecigallinarius]|nr:methyltransferase domain-containing protein [Candidatus Amulumruptor caecigallinarius]MCM1397201.1 methyltransferase domain-containing protein [Candidatus Amulumruptor caecigallinarius]MCM1453110.1 methyltransferase domain-containing protein [bacterium]